MAAATEGTILLWAVSDQQELAHGGPKIQCRIPDRPPTPVEITFKPNPVYTDEARQLKLEGEVLLEVMFGANGHLHVNRVVRGLGHGLDEAAVAAANRMRFKPALRTGQPVDSTAIVHVISSWRTEEFGSKSHAHLVLEEFIETHWVIGLRESHA